MKKRILSLLLVLALVLTGIPAVFARETGLVVDPVAAPEVEETTGGPLSLPVYTGAEDTDVETAPQEESGMAPNLATEGATKFESEFTPFTQQVDMPGYRATDKVTFIVEMNGAPLLSNFSKEEIVAQTAAVASYQDKQMANINALKTNLTTTFAEEEDFEIGFTYTIATTGVSVTTEYGNKAEIEAMPGVSNVFVAPVYNLPEDTVSSNNDLFYPTTNNATHMIGANVLNASGYTGKGMRIAILDTGLYLDHPNFQPLPEDKLEDPLTREEIEEVWDQLNASQTALICNAYHSTKIPYIFNYSSLDYNVDHSYAQHDHGTHVAGIAAANKIESSPVIGVAPDAQLLVMQVFQNGGGAAFDQIMAALEDCVRLDVDTANLSLGSAAGFTDDNADSAINKVFKQFEDTGIEVLVASGNDTNNAYMNNFGLNLSLTANPDIGLAGTPSTYKGALAVASVQNDASKMLYFTVGGRKIGYDDTGAAPNTTFITQFQGDTLEYVLVPNGGTPADYEGIEVDGKVALVSRGYGVSFPEKQTNAKDAGAIACIVYNNQPGVIHMQINNEAEDIPCIAVSMEDGKYLVEQEAKSLTVCNGDLMEVKMPKEISGFSSWGCTPDLKLKPEIAGVGGQVYSTTDPQISGSNYATWDGTSMATPQVAGAAAVILEYFQEHHPELKGGELRRAVANVMMSTAEVIMNGEIEYSPRAQGAGLINVVDATNTKGYLTSRGATEGRPKGEMGDDPERSGEYSFNFEINNLSKDEALTYNLDSTVMSERIHDAGNAQFIENVGYELETKVEFYMATSNSGYKFDFNKDGKVTTADARALLRHVDAVEELDSKHTDVNNDGKTDRADVEVMVSYFADQEVDVDILAKEETVGEEAVTSVTVPAGESVAVTAKIVLTEKDKAYVEQFPNGIYVEGYVYADDAAEEGVDLSMPFLGFYGDWSDAPVFDDPDPNKASLFPRMLFTNHSVVGQNPYILGGKGGDEYNAISYSNPLAELDFGQLRNAKKMTFVVTDKNTGEEYFHIEGEMMAKSFFNAGYGQVIPTFLANDPQGNELWDGKNKDGEDLPDGTQVTYTATAYLDDGDDDADDSFSFDLILDTQFPVIENQNELQEALTFEGNRTSLKLDLKDNQHIAAVIFVAPNGKIMGKYEVDNKPGETYTAEYDITGFGNEFSIIVADYACNEREIDVVLNLGKHNDDLPAPLPLDKDRLYGCETFDMAAVEAGWFSANRSDFSEPKNETFDASNRYYSGEYVNGYLVAQSAVTGNLELVTPGGTYWSTRNLWNNPAKMGENGCVVFYDMALDYSGISGKIYNQDGKRDVLFGVGWAYKGDNDNNGKDDGYNALFRVNFYDNGYIDVEECGRIKGVEGEILTLGITTEGEIYGINTTGILHKINPEAKDDEQLGKVIECTAIGTTEFTKMPNYSGVNVIQSMGYDHNSKQMYWYAHSQTPVNNRYVNVCMTYTIDLETAECTEVGTYGPGGQTTLFVPHDMESDLFKMGVQPTNVILNPNSMLMVEGQTVKIKTEWNPWNANPAKVTWKSNNEDLATVDEYGFVTAKKSGKVSITATAEVLDWEGNPTQSEQSCEIEILPSEDELYSFIIADYKDQTAVNKWVTYSDKTPLDTKNLGSQKITIKDQEGEDVVVDAMWYGGAYYNGYIYTVTKVQNNADGVISDGMNLYRSKVNQGETSDKTTFGEPEFIGYADGVEIINIAFDYTSSRLYAVDAKRGGLGLLDMDNGHYEYLGDFNGDCGGPIVATAMTVTKDGTIVIADMQSALYTVHPDTMYTTKIYDGGADSWYYAAMTYDYNTDSIYWNPCMGAKTSPLNLVRLVDDEFEEGRKRAIVMDIGDVSTKDGVEQTVMFAIPENEPEAQQIPVESIEITNGEKIQGLIGGKMQLTTETKPARPSVRTRIWKSSNEDVVKVDNFGVATFVGEGTAQITVSITNKDEATHGGPFTDSIEVEVYQSAGKMEAFLGSDEYGSGYYDFWISMNDYDLGHAAIGQSMISVYSLRAGIYYDGYYYATTHTNDLIRINAQDRGVYTVIGHIDDEAMTLTGMALDYTTGIVYGVTISGDLVTVDLNTAEFTVIGKTDKKVFAIAVDKDGVLYGAGSENSYTEGTLYTINKESAACTEMMKLPCTVYTGPVYYGEIQYNAQMTYDFGTDRLYLNSGSCTKQLRSYDGMFMIQLDQENPAPVELGGIALQLRGTPRQGKAYLGLMTFIPEVSELPVHEVNGLILEKNFARMPVGGTMKLGINVRPSNAANTAVTWTSSSDEIITVDQEGNLTGVSAGTATITATSVANNAITASCQVTVTEVTEKQSVAYTAVVGQDAMYKFNPALPAQTAEKIGTVSGKITGVTAGKDCLYVMVASGPVNKLYTYDLVTNQMKYITDVESFFELNGIAYDEENNLLYGVGGFYTFQYDLSKADSSGGFLRYSNFMMDPDYITMNSVAVVDGEVYCIGTNMNASASIFVKYDKYFKERTVLSSDLGLKTMAGKSEMAYDSSINKLYITDVTDSLYTMDVPTGAEAEIELEPVDKLGENLVFSGLAIVAASAE